MDRVSGVTWRRPEHGREVQLCLTEVQLAQLVDILSSYVHEDDPEPVPARLVALLEAADDRLREVTGPAGALECSSRPGDRGGH